MLNREQINVIKEGWASGLLLKYKEKFVEFFVKLKHQFEYNATAKSILKEYITTGTISKADASELKNITSDLLKMVGLGSIVALPGGMLLMLFLVNSAKHLGIDLIPSHFESVTTEYIDLKTYDLKALFDEINKECFGGELQHIPIIVKPLKSVTAKYNAKLNKSKTPYLTTDDVITISNLTHYTKEKIKNILCHEMIHYWVNSRLDTSDHHGIHFIENMNRVNRLGYNVNIKDEELGAINQEISTTENLFITGGYAKTWKFYALTTLSSIKKMRPTEIENLLKKYDTETKFEDTKWYITTAPETKQFKMTRDMGKYSVMKPSYNYLLDGVINSTKTRSTNLQEVMSLSNVKINESVHAGVDYALKIENDDEDGDRISVVLYNTNPNVPYLIGKLVFEKTWNGLDMIGVVDEDRYNDIFPDDEYVKIEHVKVEDAYAQMGFGRILMEEAIKEIKKTNFNRIYINASPMGSRIPLDDLIKFYESLGFKILFNKESRNAEMYMII